MNGGCPMNKSRRKLKGFTLLELIIVIAILAVLSAILIPSISDYIRTNHIQSANSQAQQVYMAAQDYLVSEQVKGVRASDIMDGTPKLCWILVTTEQGYDSGNYDKNKTSVVDSYGIKSDYVQTTVDSKTKYPIADGIESRLESSFKGSWAVAFYPNTFTVAYAVYNDYYKTTTECSDAVKLIGTNGGQHSDTSCDDRLYLYEFNIGGTNAKQSQESDFIHPDSSETPHMYTGQFPVPVH